MNRQVVLGLGKGIGIIIITGGVFFLISLVHTNYLLRTVPFDEFMNVSKNSFFNSQFFDWIRQICYFAVFFCVGFVAVKPYRSDFDPWINGIGRNSCREEIEKEKEEITNSFGITSTKKTLDVLRLTEQSDP